ncbi:hypothetical protein [Pannonibacter tanglangensis]|uniref:hypothetical protein n=1 Tax=Pannonibacter tanglangensis TaxID=2750084 RepID=UPI0015D41CF9|nr:hypothetical protein [Pannonibacter sp. XCT-34]
MSTEQVKNEIRRFLKAEDKLALCLSGKWGVGKTHTWDTLLTAAFKNDAVWPQRYAYVSLFGLENLSDVRRSVFENTVEAAAFREKERLEATLNSVSERLAQLSSKWRAGLGMIRGIPVVADYAGLVEAGFLDVRNQIVCFDDLERMSDSLDLKDVLGLISFLKEKKNCKVVLLLNSEALEGQNAEDFRVQLEKVIDINLTFAPTASEAVAIAVPDRTTLLTQMVAEYAAKLEITNIRTIFKLLRICGRLEEVLEGYDARIIKQAFHSACLFGFAIYQPTEAPSIDTILKDRTYADLVGDREEPTPKEIQHSELLTRYEFHTADGLDRVVFDCIHCGFFDEVSLRREADVLKGRLKLRDQDAAFSKVWDIYHGTFDDNADAFATQLKQSIRDNAAAISPADLSASIATLKKLNHGDGLDDLIKDYVDSRDDGKDFWAVDPVSWRFNIEDPDVIAAFAAKASVFADDRTLKGVATAIVRDGAWSEDTLEFIDKHTADDFYAAMKATKGEELRLIVKGLTYFRNVGNANERMKSISGKAVSALQRIGQESAINRLRVEKFSVVVP